MTLMTLVKRASVAVMVASWFAACGGESATQADSNTGDACLENETRQCACEDGSPGAMSCLEDQTFGVCECCGNAALEGAEECDGTNINGETCAGATMGGMTEGTPTCNDGCHLDLSGCRTPAPVATGGTSNIGTGGSGATLGGGGLGMGGLMGGGGTGL
jgi:hypothetical protein